MLQKNMQMITNIAVGNYATQMFDFYFTWKRITRKKKFTYQLCMYAEVDLEGLQMQLIVRDLVVWELLLETWDWLLPNSVALPEKKVLEDVNGLGSDIFNGRVGSGTLELQN